MAGIVKFLQIILFYILSYLGLTQCAFKVADCETYYKEEGFVLGDTCSKECDLEDESGACFILGKENLRHEWSYDEGITYLNKACKLNNKDACELVRQNKEKCIGLADNPDYRIYIGGRYKSNDNPEHREYFASNVLPLCKAFCSAYPHDGYVCGELGKLYLYGEFDYASRRGAEITSLFFLESACQLNDASACSLMNKIKERL